MKKQTKIADRPRVVFLQTAYNDIINTIGSLPAESGGLLFGKEDDMVVRKIVFDKHARTSRSTYTFNTEFLNPEIKRLWKEEGLSCIGFIHSHPRGYGHPSPPDVAYFSSMFENMPRQYYITPIVYTVPDGGFQMNLYIMPDKSREITDAYLEVLPDDYYLDDLNKVEIKAVKKASRFWKKLQLNRNLIDLAIRYTWKIWQILFVIGLSWVLLKGLYLFTNHLNKTWV